VVAAVPRVTGIADLYRATPGERGIVNHATFSGPRRCGTCRSSSRRAFDLLDKPWIAVDPVGGIVYLAWVRFWAAGTSIEFSRSLDHGTTWSPL
jgi:hypothetical protein